MKLCKSDLIKLKESVLIDIYEDWENKTRLELSQVDSLSNLSDLIPSLKYYIDYQVLSWKYDKVDTEDIRDLEYHILYYFNMFIEEQD